MKKYKFLMLLAILPIFASCTTNPVGADAYRGKSAEVIYCKGERSLQKKHYKDAISEFEAFDALYPFDCRAEQALLNLIFAYYKANDYESAIAATDRYIRLYPMCEKAAYVLFIRGVINMEHNHSWIYNAFPCDPAKRDLSNTQSAFADFAKLIQLYPNSPYACDAQKRMMHIKNLIARRELQTAEFYFSRNAYVAAANRASYVVQHLCGTCEVPRALMIMVRSYRALGETEQANEALQVLRLNYPGAVKGL
jgi:outer membrane protein assembly factor BamD